ncbi:uncharacterized protein BDV14DRAFT_45354 [Aspergillus stella-maris]|uniref:uncharacterized protein n=1 Tax=Aspergillus stella-maris TaxID=1810926 RepID=UPI003CCD39DB
MSPPWQIPRINGIRNLHIFSSDGQYLGGIWLNTPPHIDNAELHLMCEVFIQFPAGTGFWRLHKLKGPNKDQVGRLVARNGVNVTEGHYVVLGAEGQPIAVTLNTEKVVRRAVTSQTSSRDQRENQRHFKDTLFTRDACRCVITGEDGPSYVNPRRGLLAAHIYPVARLEQWQKDGCQNWISGNSNTSLIAPAKMFSAQNGLILCTRAHLVFDFFEIAVNPDRGYRTIFFGFDKQGLGGRVLSRSTKSGPIDHQVSDECLRWHYRQAIMVHMRGAGEPPWDTYDDQGGDVGRIMELPDGAEILEAELGNRLGAYVDVEV